MFRLRRQNRFERQKREKEQQRKHPTRRRLSEEQKQFLKHIIFGVMALLIMAGLLYSVHFLARLQSVTISKVTIVGGQTIASETVEEKVLRALEGDYFKLIPRRFSYFYPKEDIISAIKEIERVHNVHVERTSRTELAVVFEEYVPYALWCSLEATEKCFFIDPLGFAFTGAPELTGGAMVRYETIGATPARGQFGFTKDELRYTEWFVDALKVTLDLYAVSVAVDVEGDAYFTLSGGGQLITSMREGKEDTFENLLTILNSDEFKHIEPGNFQYIDLRFGNKVFVNEELAPPPSDDRASGTASSSVSF